MSRPPLLFQITMGLNLRFCPQIWIATVLFLRYLDLAANLFAWLFNWNVIDNQQLNFFFPDFVEWLVKFGRTIWEYIFEHSNNSWFIIGFRRTSYPSHIYHFFYRRLESKPNFRASDPQATRILALKGMGQARPSACFAKWSSLWLGLWPSGHTIAIIPFFYVYFPFAKTELKNKYESSFVEHIIWFYW